MTNLMLPILLITVWFLCTDAARAETAQDFLNKYATQAKQEDPGFTGCDPKRGAMFYKETHGGEWNCATCHTEDPKSVGKHAETQKIIDPLAPSVNAERFTDPLKVEKWFKRSCKDVLGRECTPQEKGDFLAYVISVK